MVFSARLTQADFFWIWKMFHHFAQEASSGRVVVFTFERSPDSSLKSEPEVPSTRQNKINQLYSSSEEAEVFISTIKTKIEFILNFS